MGALREPFPSPVAPHPPPRWQRPGSGDWPPPASQGSSGAAQPEQEGKGRRGPGRRRKAAAAAANPAGQLAVTEIGRTGSGGGRRGLAPGLARLSAAGCVFSATEGVGNRRGRGRANARLSLQPRGVTQIRAAASPHTPARKRAGAPGPASHRPSLPAALPPCGAAGPPPASRLSPSGFLQAPWLRPRPPREAANLAPRPPPRWALSPRAGAALLPARGWKSMNVCSVRRDRLASGALLLVGKGGEKKGSLRTPPHVLAAGGAVRRCRSGGNGGRAVSAAGKSRTPGRRANRMAGQLGVGRGRQEQGPPSLGETSPSSPAVRRSEQPLGMAEPELGHGSEQGTMPLHARGRSDAKAVPAASCSGEAAAAPAAPAFRPRSREPVPASSARRSRPAEQADGKSQFLPHINKVGTGRTALGAEREGKGVGSLLHGPLPAQPRLSPAPGAPSSGGRWPRCAEADGPGGSVRRRDGTAGGKQPPRAVPAVGAARAGRQRGSGAQFLPSFLGPAARPPPARLGSSRPRVHSHGRTLSHTGTPPLAHAHRLPRSTLPLPTHIVSQALAASDFHTHGAARRPRLLSGHVTIRTSPPRLPTPAHTHEAPAAHDRWERSQRRARAAACVRLRETRGPSLRPLWQSSAATAGPAARPRLMLSLRPGPRAGGPGGGSAVRSAAAMCVLPEPAGERPTAPEERAELAESGGPAGSGRFPPPPGARRLPPGPARRPRRGLAAARLPPAGGGPRRAAAALQTARSQPAEGGAALAAGAACPCQAAGTAGLGGPERSARQPKPK
ncbi:spidroin-2-like [Aphelocoma coerulescens]|uniref:spidroin-2-like n=1 Tax=Aphelocoma coerulescens TaxID=39617 RepID=UPI0036046F39